MLYYDYILLLITLVSEVRESQAGDTNGSISPVQSFERYVWLQFNEKTMLTPGSV